MMIIISYINSNVNIPYNILIICIKRIKQYQTDLDFQQGFQGIKIFFTMYKVNIDTYILFYLCNKCINKMNSMFKTDV